MNYINVKGHKDGKEIQIKCSQLVLGASDFLRIDNMDFAAPVLNKFIELGGNTFDTARQYRHSEKALAEWIEMRNIRDDIVILTKGCHPTREEPKKARVTPQVITEDLLVSLETLKTDHVELYALHRDDESVPVGPIMEILNEHIHSGKIYAIGASNWELPRIIEANKYAEEHGLIGFTFNSPNLSLAKCRKPRWEGCVSADSAMISWHEKTKLPLFSWSAQAGGFFSGRFTRENKDDQEMVDVFYNDDNWERYDRAVKMAEDKGLTPIQTALAYVLNQKFPTTAVIGPENITELISSYNGSKLSLTAKEVDWLDLK